MWEFLRRQIKKDLKRAEQIHKKHVKEFHWKGYGRDWEKIDAILDWEHEESKTRGLNQMLDEIQGKKCHTVIMSRSEFKKWKEKINNG